MKIGIVSDIHEDIKSLKEAMLILSQQGCHKIACLGDFTGYDFIEPGVANPDLLESRNAHEVLKLLRKKCEFILAGNHDLYSVKKIPKNKAHFAYPRNWYSLDYQTRKKLSKDKLHLYEHNSLSPLLTKDDELFVKKLPEYRVEKYDTLKILFSHYAYPDLIGDTKHNITTSKDARMHFTFMEKHGCTLGISGHDHCDGMQIFTKNEVRKVPCNKKIKLTNQMTWLHGPCVVNAGRPNGLMIFDTNTMEITAVLLKAK